MFPVEEKIGEIKAALAANRDVVLSDEDKAGLKSLLSLGSDVRKVVVKGSSSTRRPFSASSPVASSARRLISVAILFDAC